MICEHLGFPEYGGVGVGGRVGAGAGCGGWLGVPEQLRSGRARQAGRGNLRPVTGPKMGSPVSSTCNFGK